MRIQMQSYFQIFKSGIKVSIVIKLFPKISLYLIIFNSLILFNGFKNINSSFSLVINIFTFANRSFKRSGKVFSIHFS